jgi:hypothetical protein
MNIPTEEVRENGRLFFSIRYLDSFIFSLRHSPPAKPRNIDRNAMNSYFYSNVRIGTSLSISKYFPLSLSLSHDFYDHL